MSIERTPTGLSIRVTPGGFGGCPVTPDDDVMVTRTKTELGRKVAAAVLQQQRIVGRALGEAQATW